MSSSAAGGETDAEHLECDHRHAGNADSDGLLSSGGAQLDVLRLAPAGLAAQVAGARVEVPDSTGSQSLFLHVIGAGGAVSAATRSDAAGQTGAQMTFADGRSALVRFSDAGTGGSLELRDAGGGILFGGALPAGVTPPPLFVD